jgi:hypothetical protein
VNIPGFKRREYATVEQLQEVSQDLERREYAVAVREPPRSGPEVRGGAYGVDDSWYMDLYAGGPDTNPLLSGRAKYEVYEEMRTSDPTVRSVLWMFKLPIRQASWRVDAVSEDPLDQIVAEAVEWQFGLGPDENDGRLDLTWDESLQQALLFLDYGAMFEEIVWGEPETWTDSSGTDHLVRPINRLAPRFPRTVFRTSHDVRTGKLDWIQQDLPGALPIPGELLCHYALEREGRNWWGVSMLRAMYGSWRLKKAVMIAAGIGWDRHAVGTPVVRYPIGGGQKALDQARQIGREYRTHERAYVALEGPAPGPGQPGTNLWDMSILDGSKSLADPVPLLKEYDMQIATAGLQMFSRLATTPSGNRAVGEILSDPFYMAARAVAGHVASVRTRDAVRKFVDRNFGTEVGTPQIRFSKIQGKNIPVLAAAISDLTNAGMTFTDVPTQNDVREQLDLDDLPDEVAATLEGMLPRIGGGADQPASDDPAMDPTETAGQTTTEQLVDTGGASAYRERPDW